MVYYDETEMHWCADIGKGYQLINEQNRITSPGQDEVKYTSFSVSDTRLLNC